MNRFLFAAATCLLTTIALADAGSSRVWNRFHGANGQGALPDASLPAAFVAADANDESIDNAKSWSVPLGSRDVGSPIIHDDVCYLLASVPSESKISLHCRELATGNLRWEKSFDQTSYHLHRRNTLAATTPATDEDRVYFAYADADHTWLIALDHEDGSVLWERDFGSWQSSHGFGSSPQVVGDKVVLLLSQQAEQLKPGLKPGDSRLVAVDAKTGKDTWSTQLKATRCCYGIPAIYEKSGRTFLVGANTGNGLFSVDASDGKIVWEQLAFDMRCCSTPVIVDGVAIGTSGSGGGGNHLVAVKIPDDGESPKKIYRLDKFMPYVPTPAVKGGLLFTVDDKGIAACVRAADGEVMWKQRLGGNFGASPVIVGDHVLMTSLEGDTHVIKAAESYQPVCQFNLGGPVGSSPAIDSKRLLIRVGETLNCWDSSP